MFSTILVAGDGSAASLAACRAAAREARQWGARLVAVTVVHPGIYEALLLGACTEEEHDPACGRVRDVLEREAQAVLAALLREAGDAGMPAEPLLRWGKPVDEILAAARDCGADLIVLGSVGQTGLQRVLLGSVSTAVVEQSAVTTLVVRPPSGASE